MYISFSCKVSKCGAFILLLVTFLKGGCLKDEWSFIKLYDLMILYGKRKAKSATFLVYGTVGCCWFGISEDIEVLDIPHGCDFSNWLAIVVNRKTCTLAVVLLFMPLNMKLDLNLNGIHNGSCFRWWRCGISTWRKICKNFKLVWFSESNL